MKGLEDQLLKALNRDRDWRGYRHVASAKAMRGEGPTAAPVEEYRKAVAAFRVRLLELVDEWMSSGKQDGAEYPKQRKLTPATGAHTALLVWDHDNKPHTFRAQTGELRILAGHYESKRPAEQHDNPIKRMRQEAVGVFDAVMNDLSLKFQLAKCDRCAEYHFRKKLRPRYLTGRSFCRACVKGASTRISIKNARETAHKDLLKEAVAALERWPGLSDETRAKYKTEETYIARSLKKRGVGVKWVTRNMDEVRQFNSSQDMVGSHVTI
jgi:hypothetical protein